VSKKIWWILTSLLVLSSMLIAACQPTPAPPVTVVVTATGEAAEGQEPVEIVVTATPTPEPTEEPPPEVNPSFSNEDTYVIVNGAGEPESLDPSWTYETAGSAVENNIYEGLIWFKKDSTDEFVGQLATDWSVSEDGATWTFNIREGVTFHEGGTLEPHDIAYSLQRGILQDRVDGPHWMTIEAFFADDEGNPFYTIESVAKYVGDLEDDVAFEDIPEDVLVETCEMVKERIVADDEAGTVTYNLRTATPWFLSMLANTFMGATYDSEWMAENGAWDGSCDTWAQFHDPAAEETILFDQANGTGPYVLDHWTPGEEIVLTAFEDYWRDEPIWEGGPSGPARIKRVVIRNIDEWGTRLAMFEAGDADYIYVPAQYRSQIEPYYKVVCEPDGECEEMDSGYIQAWVNLPQVAMTPAQFNWNISTEGGNPFVGSGELDGNGIPPDFFQDEDVRKAFNYCFDFQTMIDDALAGEGIQAQGPIIAGMMGYREGEDPIYSYDPAQCEEHFMQAFDGELWEQGFYMQLAYNTGNDTRRLASEILKAGIEAVNPNFTVSVVGMPWPVLLNSRRAQKLPIYVGGWLEDFHDPHNWVHPFLHSHGAYGRVINMPEDLAAEYDALIEEGASLTDPEARREVYEEIQLKAQEDAVVIWLYQAVGRVHLQTWMEDFYYNPAYSGAHSSYIYAWNKVAP
jgi:peptide/nickel transport system substrate-binding protein